jgi:hypothetical protein
MNLLSQIPRSSDDIRPHFSSILIPLQCEMRTYKTSQERPKHLSYAEDVRKEMTKPSTVPRTVKSWLEIPRSFSVFSDTKVTTIRN